jgi:hypothetical protein
MPIVGFNFNKIIAEKNNKIIGKVDIKNNLSIKSIEQEKIALEKSEEILKFNFEYVISYEPSIGKIAINGNVLYMAESKKIKEILNEWKKEKKLSKELAPKILNTILAKCNIKALTLSQEVSLPPHLKMPFVKSN